MNFGIYLIGYLIVIAGAVYIMHLMHVPQTWITGVVIILVGAAIVTGVQSTRTKDRS